MFDDYLEDDCELDRHTVEELQAWLKHLGMKLVDKDGETVPLSMVAYTAELANSTTALRMKLLGAERDSERKDRTGESGLEWGRAYTMKEAAEITGQSLGDEADAEGDRWVNPGVSTKDAMEALDTFGVSIKRLDE